MTIKKVVELPVNVEQAQYIKRFEKHFGCLRLVGYNAKVVSSFKEYAKMEGKNGSQDYHEIPLWLLLPVLKAFEGRIENLYSDAGKHPLGLRLKSGLVIITSVKKKTIEEATEEEAKKVNG